MSRLGETLVAAGVLDPAQLVIGLTEQILTGGRLGSQLVATGQLRPAILAQWLARVTGVLAADLTIVHAAPRAWVSEELARREMALPLAVAGGSLRCALTEPRDGARLERLRHAVKRPIEPEVAAEGALLDAIDRAYAAGHDPTSEPAGAVHGGRAPHQATRPMRATGPTRPKAMPISAVDGQRLLDGADDRDAIAQAQLLFARGRLDGAIVFALRQGRAHGWRAEGVGVDEGPIQTLVLPIAGTAWLERTTADRVRTAAPGPLAPLQGPGRELATIPVVVGGRVVSVLAGVVRTGIPDPTLRALEAHAVAAAAAYERLIARLAA